MHGLSRPYVGFSYQDTAEILHEILNKEKIETVFLVGMSIGGYPCQHFAALYPHMVKGFVALDTTPLGMTYYSKSDLWWLKQVAPMAKLFSSGFLRQHRTMGTAGFGGSFVPIVQYGKWEIHPVFPHFPYFRLCQNLSPNLLAPLCGAALRKSMAWSVSMTKYSYQKMMSMLKPLSKAEIKEQMKIAYEFFPLENKEVHFEFPVLILVGEKDITGKVKAYCREWSRKTGYPLHYIKNAKHFSNGDNPEQVNSEIADFINSIIGEDENDLL